MFGKKAIAPLVINMNEHGFGGFMFSSYKKGQP